MRSDKNIWKELVRSELLFILEGTCKTSRSYCQVPGAKRLFLKQPSVNAFKNSCSKKTTRCPGKDPLWKIKCERAQAACWPTALQKWYFTIGRPLEKPVSFRATLLKNTYEELLLVFQR